MARTSRSRHDAASRLENLIYHLSEMEAAVDMGGIVWSDGQATTVCRRLLALTIQIMRITAPSQGQAD